MFVGRFLSLDILILGMQQRKRSLKTRIVLHCLIISCTCGSEPESDTRSYYRSTAFVTMYMGAVPGWLRHGMSRCVPIKMKLANQLNIRTGKCGYFLVHSFAVARNFALSVFMSLQNKRISWHSEVNYDIRLTAAISGSNGSSGLGLLSFSCITARTSFCHSQQTFYPEAAVLPEERLMVGFHLKRQSVARLAPVFACQQVAPYLVSEYGHADMALFIDSWMVNLGGKSNLCRG